MKKKLLALSLVAAFALAAVTINFDPPVGAAEKPVQYDPPVGA